MLGVGIWRLHIRASLSVAVMGVGERFVLAGRWRRGGLCAVVALFGLMGGGVGSLVVLALGRIGMVGRVVVGNVGGGRVGFGGRLGAFGGRLGEGQSTNPLHCARPAVWDRRRVGCLMRRFCGSNARRAASGSLGVGRGCWLLLGRVGFRSWGEEQGRVSGEVRRGKGRE